MVAPVIASAIGSKAVDSATTDGGLVNQAFKLTVLIALALAIGVGIFLIWRLTGVFAGVFSVFEGGIDAIARLVSVPQIAFTALISASPIGRAWGAVVNRDW